MGGERVTRLALATCLLVCVAGCASSRAFRQGEKEAHKGNWDLAVARFTKAVAGDPKNISYRIALDTARIQASRMHLDEARKHQAADDLERAADELQIAVNYDPSNKNAGDELQLVRDKLLRREAERQRQEAFDDARQRARLARVPVPVLSPRSPVPISINLVDQSLEKVFEVLSKLTGVNILFDEGFRDKRVTVRLSGVTFEEALEQITLVNRLFYKVVDQNTLIIVPDSRQKRRAYDDQLVQTFYLDNIEVQDAVNVLKGIITNVKAVPNAPLGAVTVIGTPDELAVAQRILLNNDKALGEVVIEVQFLEVNRNALKRYGIELSNYEASTTLSPTGAEGEVEGGFTNVRAHLLSSLNLADWVVSIPSTLFARFLQTDSTVKILAAPRLRAAEGKKTELRIGTEVPVPVTTFTATSAGTSTFAPATSFNYRNVGVNLQITPRVTAAGDITLEVVVEFSTLGENRNVGTGQNPINVPTFLTRNLTGNLRVRDGQTTLIGGLLSTREARSMRGALGISSIPVIGSLFSGNTNEDEQGEVLISLTPRLVRAPKVTDDNLEPLYAGTAEGIRVPSARPLFGPEEVAPSESPTPEEGAPAAAPTPGERPEEAEAAPGEAEAVEPSEPGTATEAAPLPEAAQPAPSTSPTPAATPGEAEPAPTSGPAATPTPTPTPTPAAAPAASAVLLSPPRLALRVGQVGSLLVVVTGAEDLRGVELELAYDGGAFEATDVVAGYLLTLDGTAVAAQRQLESGRVTARFTRATGARGAGAVATIPLRGLAPGGGSVRVVSLRLITGAGGAPLAPPPPSEVVVEP